MKSIPPVVYLSLSCLLGGCCMYATPDNVDRIEMSEFHPGPWCGIFSGYGTTAEPERAQALYSPVAPSEYGDILCEGRSVGDRASCVNQVVDYFRESRRSGSEGPSNQGPFAVSLNGKLYFGSYRNDPFSGYFRVSNSANGCTGSYNAFLGATDPIFAVRCDDGRTGTAEIVRDREGRNGIGYVAMDDGSKGKIVFGRSAIGSAGVTGNP
jgi:hypothetical protein